MKRLLLLMTTRTYRARAFMESATRLKFPLVVGSEKRQTLQDNNPAGHLTISFNDLAEAVDAIVAYDSEHPIGGIVAADDDGVFLAARAGQALGLRGNDMKSVATARDKHATRLALEAAGLPVPWFIEVRADEPPEQIVQRVKFPCVIKPLFLAGSRGVIRVENVDEFIESYHRVSAILMKAEPYGGEADSSGLLIEGYIPGDEMAVEGLIEEGRLRVLAHFDKPDPLTGPFFEETIYVTPSRKSRTVLDHVDQAASQAVTALGLTEGPVHVEMRLHEDQVWILEVAPRTIGGLCARTLRFGDGIPLEDLVLKRALGLPIDSYEREELASGVMMIPIPTAGVLSGVRGAVEARGVEGVEAVLITLPIGQEIIPLPEGARYLGFIFGRGKTPGFVERALRKSHDFLDFDIDPVDAAAGSE